MIRQARPEDAVALNELTRAAYAPWVEVIGRAPLPMLTDYAVAIGTYDVLVLEREGEIVAVMELIVASDHVLIENIAVAPDYQGQGFGEALLQAADEHTRDLGRHEIRLYTNAAFTSNLAYYKKRGFVETHREDLPDGGTVVYFSKAISTSLP